MNVRASWKMISLSQGEKCPLTLTGASLQCPAQGDQWWFSLLPRGFQPSSAKAIFLSNDIQGTAVANLVPLEHWYLRGAIPTHEANMVVNIFGFILEQNHMFPEQTYASSLIPHPPAFFEGSMTNLLLSYGHHSYIKNSKGKW